MKDVSNILKTLKRTSSSFKREEMVAEVVKIVAEFLQQQKSNKRRRLLFKFSTHVTVGRVNDISRIGTTIQATVDGHPMSFNPDELVDVQPTVDDKVLN